LVRQYVLCERRVQELEQINLHSSRGVGSGAEAERTSESRVNPFPPTYAVNERSQSLE